MQWRVYPPQAQEPVMRARYCGLFGLMLAVTLPVAAQQPPARMAPTERAAPAWPRPMLQERMLQRRGIGPEALLRLREELGLTEQQVARLEALRQEGVAARRDRMAEMLERRSQLEAGRITREQLREQMQARAAARQGAAGQRPMDRAREVLTDQQRLRLAERQVERMQRQMQVQRMQGMRGRMQERQGRGMQPGERRRPMGRPGVLPGDRGGAGAGPGMPGMRQRWMERPDSMAPRMRMRRPPGPDGEGGSSDR